MNNDDILFYHLWYWYRWKKRPPKQPIILNLDERYRHELRAILCKYFLTPSTEKSPNEPNLVAVSTISLHTLQVTEPWEEGQAENSTIFVSYCCITNYHKLSGVKSTQIYSLTGLDVRSPQLLSLSWNLIVGKTVECLGANSFPCVFQIPEASCMPSFLATFHL